MRQRTDGDPVRRAIAGDGEAFAQLVARYRDAVYGVCYHHVGQPEEAKDLAQETFLRAYLDLGRLRNPAAFPGWLRRVAERVCGTWRRGQRLRLTSLDNVPDPAAERDLDMPLALRQALARLTDEARLAVTLYYINGYTTREVGEFLGIPAGTVKSRLHHARRRLKEDLMDDYRDALRQSVPGPEFEGAVVRAVRSLEELRSHRWGEGARVESEEALNRYLVLEKDGSVLGVSYYDRDQMPLRGVTVQVARARGTTGEGEWQEKGFEVYDRLAPSALAQLAEAGFVLAATHEEMMCATRHGYVPCFYHHRIRVAAQNLTPADSAGTVRAYRDSDAEAVARLRALDRPRPAMWAWQGPGPSPDYVLERDGGIAGCCSLAPSHRQSPAVLLNEMEGDDMAAYRALAKHWAETALSKGVDMLTSYLSPEHPVGRQMLACGGVCETQGASWNLAKDEEHLCILDLAGALRAIAPGLGRPAKGRVSIAMDGQTATVTAGDPLRVEEGLPAGATPCRIGRVSMTQLLVGYCSVFEIQGRADVAISDADSPILDSLFPKTWPYSWPDPYVWDEDILRGSRPWAFNEPWLTRLSAHPRPWV